MKNLIILISLFSAMTTFGQVGERIVLKGKAKLISTWSWKTENTISNTLSSGDKLTVKLKSQTGIEVNVTNNNSPKMLLAINESEDLYIQCYEYDFDSDGKNEIIIASSPEVASINVYVFKYNKGISELVGSFGSTNEIGLSKNEISLPMGFQGLRSEYSYRNGAFYELIYHKPKNN